ncbi:unnamed protein product [Spirodela intermedia]|uniref:Uncharacterized protein n=1 Tax=Spirodela intermedia TaxID=51605 RepID=A0A7I8K090_SPIIN|nr:unnamed protein product [Spirodela intermedia]
MHIPSTTPAAATNATSTRLPVSLSSTLVAAGNDAAVSQTRLPSASFNTRLPLFSRRTVDSLPFTGLSLLAIQTTVLSTEEVNQTEKQ